MKTFRVFLAGGGERHHEAECYDFNEAGDLFLLRRRFDGLSNPTAMYPRGTYDGIAEAGHEYHHAHEHDEYRDHEQHEYPFDSAAPSLSRPVPQPAAHVDHRDAGGRFTKE